jgi:glycogen operon protein
MSREEWDDGTRKTLGMYLAGDDPARTSDEAYLIWFHAGAEPTQVELPDGAWATTYTVVAHTGRDGELPSEKIAAGSALQLPARTVVVLQVD